MAGQGRGRALFYLAGKALCQQADSHLGGLYRPLAVRQMQTEKSGLEHHLADTDSATSQPPLCADQMPPCVKHQQSLASCSQHMQAAPCCTALTFGIVNPLCFSIRKDDVSCAGHCMRWVCCNNMQYIGRVQAAQENDMAMKRGGNNRSML